MAEIRLFDSSFVGTESASIGGDNIGIGPSNFRWARDGPITTPAFFTDSQLLRTTKSEGALSERCVALLLEPRTLRKDHYYTADIFKNYFDTILTYDKELLADPKYKFYPYGGSWIRFDRQKMWDKQWDVSIIASGKKTSDGHRLRHDVVSAHAGIIDMVCGGGYEPVRSKLDALALFRYSVVIESGKFDYYWTEKLIDCLSVGTIPIYYGCPSIGDFFNMDGIIAVDSLKDIGIELAMVCEQDYEERREAVEDNLQRAKKYRICEDWIWDNYPEVFG